MHLALRSSHRFHTYKKPKPSDKPIYKQSTIDTPRTKSNPPITYKPLTTPKPLKTYNSELVRNSNYKDTRGYYYEDEEESYKNIHTDTFENEREKNSIIKSLSPFEKTQDAMFKRKEFIPEKDIPEGVDREKRVVEAYDNIEDKCDKIVKYGNKNGIELEKYLDDIDDGKYKLPDVDSILNEPYVKNSIDSNSNIEDVNKLITNLIEKGGNHPLIVFLNKYTCMVITYKRMLNDIILNYDTNEDVILDNIAPILVELVKVLIINRRRYIKIITIFSNIFNSISDKIDDNIVTKAVSDKNLNGFVYNLRDVEKQLPANNVSDRESLRALIKRVFPFNYFYFVDLKKDFLIPGPHLPYLEDEDEKRDIVDEITDYISYRINNRITKSGGKKHYKRKSNSRKAKTRSKKHTIKSIRNKKNYSKKRRH